MDTNNTQCTSACGNDYDCPHEDAVEDEQLKSLLKDPIYIFIVENEVLAKGLIKDHFKADQITFAQVIKGSERQRAIAALETLE